MKKFKITKGEAKQIIREEVEKILFELENPTSVELREMVQKAIANLEEHALLIKEITYQLSMNGQGQQQLIELVKAHGLYLKMLENTVESLR